MQLAQLVASNAFYAPIINRSTPSVEFSSLADFFENFPFTTKHQIVDDQSSNPPFGTNLTFPVELCTRFNQTSGTSGRPLIWLDTDESWSWLVENWMQVMRVSGVTPGDRIYFAFSFGPFLGFWSAFDAGVKLGCLSIPGGGLGTTARLHAIMQTKATVLCCTPTYAIRLGETARDEGIELASSSVRIIIVAGEPGAGIPATRTRLQALWPHAEIKDHHGMTEVGPVTYECPVRRGCLHVLEDAFIPEVVHPVTGKRMTNGEQGELVLTNLGRSCSPLIRYKTGDLVCASANAVCDCGRSEMALVGGILGRVDDMVVVRGVNVYPSAIETIVREYPDVAEYQVQISEVNGLTELIVIIEPVNASRNRADLIDSIESSFRNRLSLRVPVQCVEAGALPRFEMKSKRWVRT